MNKVELIDEVVKLADVKNLTKAAVEKVLVALLEAIKKGVKKDGTVQLIGFGTFKKVSRKARMGRNPKTGEAIKIKASKSVGFKVGKAFKEKM
jgi:DNA-binding protein HU-beta